MLKQAKIKNFEAHKETTLDFSPGVNCIIGESDQGKSAILRALEWNLFNQPLGADVCSNWLEDINTSVELKFDKDVLIRKRTKSFNGYLFNGEEYKGFKNKIPDNIKSFINMSDINKLSQYDPLFMLSWSPGERGKFLNEICDMQIIDTSTSNINKQIRSENARIKILKETLERSEQDLNSFEDLKKMENKLLHIEKTAEQIEKLEEDCESLEDIIENLHNINKRKRKYTIALKFSDRISLLYKKHVKLSAEAANIEDLNEIIGNLYAKEEKLERAKKKQKDVQDEFKKLFPKICPLCGK